MNKVMSVPILHQQRAPVLGIEKLLEPVHLKTKAFQGERQQRFLRSVRTAIQDPAIQAETQTVFQTGDQGKGYL